MFFPEGQVRVCLYGEPVSMRLSFDGLYALTRHRMQQNPLSGHCQVAWFQRQIFGHKSEQRLPDADGVQGTLGESFAATPEVVPPNKKTLVAGQPSALRSIRLARLTQ